MNTSLLHLVSNIDQSVIAFMPMLYNSKLTSILLFITTLGDPIFLIAISAAILLIFWLKNRKIDTVQFMFSMLVGSGAVVVLKHVFMRARPLSGLVTETGYSFPSGHALVATVFFPVLVYILKGYIKSPALKFGFIVGMYTMLLAVLFSRLYLGVHYTSDVVGGFVIGIIITCISIIATETYKSKVVETSK